MKKFLNGILAFTASVVVFAVSGTVRAEDVKFSKVNSLSDLAVGDEISIVNEDNQAAVSTDQRKNNRGETKIELINEEFVYNENVQLITLAAGSKDNTFAFNVGNGFLYAASSSGNHLKTQASIDDNASWKIDINDSSTSIVAQGTNSRNVFQYNKQSKLFACYSSASQSPIAIYKKVDSSVQETTYDISFNANGGKFADGEGVKITKNVGEKESIDLSKYNPNAPYSYTKLDGWKVADTTYEPNAKVEVSSKTVFKANWAPSKVLTIEEAIKLANEVGSAATSISFTVEGYFASVDKNNSITIVDKSGNEFLAYRASEGVELAEGDLIRITGNILLYNKTPELNASATYEVVSKMSPMEKFETLEIKSSLSFDWQSSDKGVYSVSNIKLRFGVDDKKAISGASYGAFIIKASDLGNTKFDALVNSYNQTTKDGILGANEKILNQEVEVKDNVLMFSLDEANVNEIYAVIFYVEVESKIYMTGSTEMSVGVLANKYLKEATELNLSFDVVEALKTIKTE